LRRAPLILFALVAAVAALLAWRALTRSDLLDPLALMDDDTAALFSINARADSPGILAALERLRARDAARSHPRLPSWAGWLMPGDTGTGLLPGILPGRLVLAWQAPVSAGGPGPAGAARSARARARSRWRCTSSPTSR
jgi:hypothetical protein